MTRDLRMANHPNRSGRRDNPASNPSPKEIVEAREAAGLTQTEAGELIYSSLRTWQHWEMGDRRMHPAFWELFQIKLRHH
jgi:DNA-binding transcriptional regulator YiaG